MRFRLLRKCASILGIENSRSVEDALMHQNMTIGALTAMLSALMGIRGMLFCLVHMESTWLPTDALAVYTSMALLSLLFLFHSFLAFRNRIHDMSHARIVLYLYAAEILAFGINYSIRSINNGDHIMAFLISSVIIFGIFEIRPWVTLVMSGVDFCLMYHQMTVHGYNSYSAFSFFTLWLCVWAVSVIRYDMAYRNAAQREEIIRQNKILEKMSSTDGLTGLNNRFSLRQNFENYLHRNIVMMMMDIDHFKQYNDEYGHNTGDAVLTAFAQILQNSFGRENCYRYGGDEMLVIVPTDINSFTSELESVRKAVERIHVEGCGIVPSGSCGCVYGRAEREEELRKMLRQADQKLYEAKKQGRDRVVIMSFQSEVQ